MSKHILLNYKGDTWKCACRRLGAYFLHPPVRYLECSSNRQRRISRNLAVAFATIFHELKSILLLIKKSFRYINTKDKKENAQTLLAIIEGKW